MTSQILLIPSVQDLAANWVAYRVYYDSILGWYLARIGGNCSLAISEEKALAIIRLLKSFSVNPHNPIP